MENNEVVIVITSDGNMSFTGKPVGIGVMLDVGRQLISLARGQQVTPFPPQPQQEPEED